MKRLLAARARSVDIGRVGGRYFINGIGVGFDAQVAIRTRRIRRLRGVPLYTVALLQVLSALRCPRVRLFIDGTLVAERPLTLVTVGNGACHGGKFWICPDARLDDGLFDVCVADVLSVPRLMRVLPSVMRGTHTHLPEVQMHRGCHVEISSADSLPVHADGEVVSEGLHELDIELLPGRLTVLA